MILRNGSTDLVILALENTRTLLGFHSLSNVLDFQYQLQFSLMLQCFIIILFLQSLIKKDREDQNDPTMAEFFEKLKNAYRDPALLPIQFSGYDDRRSSPLLRGADV